MNDSSVAAAIVAVTFTGTVPSTSSPTVTHGALGDSEESVVRSLPSVVGQGQPVGPRTLVD